MLKSIDILIGLSVIMLMLSLVVTVMITAFNQFLQTRGKNLLEGIASLLRQIHPSIPPDLSQAIAKAVLTHPLIRAAGEELGSVVHREELTSLLLEFAAGESPQPLEAAAHDALVTLLRNNGISDPAAILANVRAVALQLERAHPELSNQARFAAAFLSEAESSFLAKINGWFDQTMDRVADRFTNSTRLVTFGASLLLALALQLDTAAIVSRLNTDSALRQQLVQQAVAQDNKALAGLADDKNTDQKQQAWKNLQSLSSVDIIDMPTSLSDWLTRWGSAGQWPMKLGGMVVTALLLSLGAPFWYNALKSLIRLRSLVAAKDDDQRASRQDTSSDGSVSPSANSPDATPPLISGERGDLTAIG